MSGLSFFEPAWLWLLVLVAILAAGYLVVHRRRTRYTVALTNLDLLASVMPRRPAWRRHVPPILVLLATLLMVVGLAGPMVRMPDPSRQSVVVLAADVSPSMMATDIRPSRFEAMQRAARDFLAAAPEETRVGLVSFAATGQVEVAPTRDHARVSAALGDLDFRSNTSLTNGVLSALNTAKAIGQPSAGIVLLSDGARDFGPPLQVAIRAARAERVPVSTIALGTPHGQVRLGEGPLDVPLDAKELSRLARETNGLTFTATSERELQAIYRNIGQSVSVPLVPVSIATWFFVAALLLTLLAAALSLLWFARMP